jgi:hypothetical protein
MKRFLVLIALVFTLASTSFAGDITATGMFQGDLYTFLSNVVTIVNAQKASANLILSGGQNQPLSVSGFVVEAVGSATFKTTATLNYAIDDALYTFAASTSIAIATAPVAQVATTSCIYLASIDADGAITWTKGANVAYGSTPVAPAVPADTCPIAEIKVDLTGAASSFTLGTTANNATGTTVTVTQIRWPRTGTSAPSSVSTTDLALTDL